MYTLHWFALTVHQMGIPTITGSGFGGGRTPPTPKPRTVDDLASYQSIPRAYALRLRSVRPQDPAGPTHRAFHSREPHYPRALPSTRSQSYPRGITLPRPQNERVNCAPHLRVLRLGPTNARPPRTFRPNTHIAILTVRRPSPRLLPLGLV